ncbi:MAG TPA: right-handed parallel beta-helix repeat-containing protein [Casimicrobiaceae bacterium]|nr:right-handed parallel beta-helix repeat-containing protein [Casimicrobiaceae bacterium]
MALGAAWVSAIDAIGVPPRRLAPWIERRAQGHNALIVGAATIVARALIALDRGDAGLDLAALRPAPAASDTAVGRSGREIVVATSREARDAIARAEPGDVITLAPGRYRFDGSDIDVARAGRDDAPITVRARAAGTVTLDFDLTEGFLVSAPDWIFENLTIRGICPDHSRCEHAFHVVGHATRFVARGNTILDFNAHFKINATGGAFPDDGRIEGNVIADTAPRRTANPVAPIDLVAASGWEIRGNRISDFVKAGGDAISVGAFAKGGGTDNRFVGNVVVCEERLRGDPGQRVGLSLGDGGTGAEFCRDRRCIVEQDRGVIESNVIASCSDDGIYLNRAAASRVADNTLIDTGGIVARYAGTAADVVGNRVDGAIVARDGAALRAADNRSTALPWLYLGWHPVRRAFARELRPGG